jgi:NAD(P)-dependent dehydrogenase (short-subunit alcohol dehydrogenase family)
MRLPDLAETDGATFDRLISIDLKGTFNGLREAARRLRKGGRIISPDGAWINGQTLRANGGRIWV